MILIDLVLLQMEGTPASVVSEETEGEKLHKTVLIKALSDLMLEDLSKKP